MMILEQRCCANMLTVNLHFLIRIGLKNSEYNVKEIFVLKRKHCTIQLFNSIFHMGMTLGEPPSGLRERKLGTIRKVGTTISDTVILASTRRQKILYLTWRHST